ncbi:hypothetical protein A4X09_0g4708 [Tilletia walkeri]|uniref:Uncharacterized protein n=1 Tax=Tilletia walkeri TaxID=117179 RepID=A0A8X7N6R0_9BASI|nr:hypothetical protein A4X09_0g4708 [Tilletia walkeri]
MSSGKNSAGKGKAQHNTPTKQQHQQQLQPPTPPPQQILALLLIQDSPQTRASFRHTLQWLIHPVLKNIASSSIPPPITLLTGIIVYSANHIHTIPFQPALEFLKTCAANARFPFTSHPPTSVQEDDDDELFQSLLSPPTPPASPPQSTTAATATAEPQQRPSRRSDTVNIANVLSAVLHMFQERSPSSTAVDPTNPLPSQYPPTHSRHLIHLSSMTTPLSFNCNPTTNIASAYDAMDALALAHEFSKLRSLSPSQSIEDPSAPTTTPELAITSIVLRAPHINQRSAHHTSHSIAPSTQTPDSQRLHWLLALSLASHDPLTAMAEVDELAPTLSDIFDNPRDILTADEHDSLMAYFQAPPSGPGPSASSSTSPLVLFSNFLTAVRASREAASSRSAESLVHRKRSLDALRAGSTSSAAYNASQSQQHQQQQIDSSGPAAKRQKMDKDTPTKAKGEAPPAKSHTHSRSASNATSSGPTADPAGHAAGMQASQLQQNKPGQPNLSPGLASVNFPAHITPGERAKIQFLHQQHAHMLKNLATIQQRITQQQQQQQQPTTAQDEEKRKVTLAQAQAQVQKVAQVRAKILGEQKALHASIVALTTPPVNKSASLDQASLPAPATVNINENFRRTLDIDTHARTLGLNLGGFSEQFHAQIQVASAKQQQQQQALHQQQQMFMQQQKQQQQQAAAAAAALAQNQGRTSLSTTEGGGQTSQQGQAGGHSGSGGPGGGIAPPTQQQQQQQQPPQPGPHRPSAFWSGAMTFLMPGVSNGAAPLATMVSASCPTTRNEGDLLMPWPRQLQLSTMIPISMRDLQTLASSRSSPIPCVLFSTLPVPAAASATAQLQADMQVQNEKIYFQLARLLELKKMGALISLQPKGSAKAASEDPEKVGPGLLLIGVPPPGGGANATAGGEGQPPSSSMATAPKLLGMVLKEAVPKALLCGAQAAAANAVSISASGPGGVPRAAPTTTAAGKGGTNTGTPASSYIGSTFGSAPAPSSLAGPAPGSVMAQNLPGGGQSMGGGGAGMNFPFGGGGGGGGNTGVNPAAMAAAAAAVAAAARQQSHPQQQQQMQYVNNAAQGQGQIPPQGSMYNNNNMGNQGQPGPPQQQTGQFVMPFGYNGGLGGAVGAAGGGGGGGGGAPGGGMMAPFGGGGGGGGNSQPSLGGGVGQAQQQQQQQQQQQAPFMQPGHGLGLGPGPGGGGGMMSGMGGGGGDGSGGGAGAGGAGGAGGMGGGGMSGAGVDIGALARMMGLGG